MQKGKDIATSFPGIFLVHHNLPGSRLPEHAHDEHEIFVPLLGELRFQFEQQTLVCGPGKMVYIPPGHQHSFQSSDIHGERIIALIDDKKWQNCGGHTHAPCVFPLSQLCRELLFYLLLHPETKNAKSLVDTLIKTLEETISTGSQEHLQNHEHLCSKASDPRLQKALQYMNQRLSSNISLSDIAQHSGLSLRSMSRLFSDELALTPKQALTHIRISRSVEILETTNTSVTEVSLDVGYASLSNFIKNFQALTGSLPSEVSRIGRKR